MPRNDEIEQEPPQRIQIGNYILENTIGKGSYGKVKQGYHRDTLEKIAVKIIEKHKLKSQKQVIRLQREIRFLKLLHHPHIIKVYDVIETTECIFIIMELAIGGELFDYIVANKRVKEKEARNFFRQVLSAVNYCHLNAVIHRDLKPENLLLDENKNIKIIDFGFGNNFSVDGKLLDTFCGSPYYAAPEMILGKKYEGPEVDMWSLGVILFALLCGHLPFDDEDPQELYKKIATGTYHTPDIVGASARHLISRLITVDPRKRATLDEVLRHPWVSEGYNSPVPTYIPDRPLITEPSLLSSDIIRRLHAFGYKDQDIQKAFSSDTDPTKAHPIRATYFLLQEMLHREKIKLKRLQMNKQLHEQMQRIENTMSYNQQPHTGHHAIIGDLDTVLPPRNNFMSGNVEKTEFFSFENSANVPSGYPSVPQPTYQPNRPQTTHEMQPQRLSVPMFSGISRRASVSSFTKVKDELRAISGWFLNVSVTTTKPYQRIIEEIQRVLGAYSVYYKFENTSFICVADINPFLANKDGMETYERGQPSVVQFQIEILADKVKEQYVLHFKRIQGGVWNYKKICNRMIGEMML